MTYRWHVFMATLDPAQGSEQAGTRPVVVVSREEINGLLPVVNVVPLTSMKPGRTRVYPNEASVPQASGGVAVDSLALAYQVRTVDKSRLVRDMGELADPEVRSSILEALRFQLAL